jgi:hypothetical protein
VSDDHDAIVLPVATIPSATRSGVSGSTVSRTPVASCKAFATTAGAGMTGGTRSRRVDSREGEL